MVLKKKINYQLRLFLPIAGMLWLIIIGFALIQVQREKDFLAQNIISRIEFINSRVIDLYDKDEDPTAFINFLDDYYETSVLEDVSVAIFNIETGERIADIGFEAPLPDDFDADGAIKGAQINKSTPGDTNLDPDKTFCYKEQQSADGKILVQTILPYSTALRNKLRVSPWWWIFITIAGITMTIITYLTTSHLSRNVKLLRRFAENAANDRDFVALDKFPTDDLGEISRQIINIYNTRNAAIASREIEHRVALKATEDRIAMRRQMTNNISHELKTPVGIIRGYIDTLVENPDMDDDSRLHFLSRAQAQVERLCNLLNDLSTITRLEEGSQKTQLDEVNFNELLDNIANDVVESGLIGDMQFKVDIPPHCIIKANYNLLTGALMNLVKNAANYSRGTEMGITLLTQNQRFYTFTFYDNGTGVAEEHIPLLFERFYRIDMGRSRKVGGTGLGLPIVRSAINTLGGTVSVRNRQGGGLEFIFTLNKWQSKKDSSDNTTADPTDNN